MIGSEDVQEGCGVCQNGFYSRILVEFGSDFGILMAFG